MTPPRPRTLLVCLVLAVVATSVVAGCLSPERSTGEPQSGEYVVTAENPDAPGLTHGPTWSPPTTEDTVAFNNTSLDGIPALRRTVQKARRDPWYGETTVGPSTADRIERAIASFERSGHRYVTYGNHTYRLTVGRGAINQTS